MTRLVIIDHVHLLSLPIVFETNIANFYVVSIFYVADLLSAGERHSGIKIIQGKGSSWGRQKSCIPRLEEYRF